jgi:flagellar hook-length control protein FliK
MVTATATTSHVTDTQPVIVGPGTATTNSTSTQDTTASLREQICMSVQNAVQQGQRQITIDLNPPELGKVSIKFTEQGGQLTGSLEVTNPQTRADIQQAMPEVLRSLELSGISVKRIDVSLSDISGQSSQDFSRESASQNQWGQLAQQGFDNTGGGRLYQDSYVASTHFSGVSEFGGDTGSGWNQSSSSENLLNVLI